MSVAPTPVDVVSVVVVLTNLALLGASRLGLAVRIVALQGCAVGLLPWLAHLDDPTAHVVALSAAVLALKGIVFPRFLNRALRDAEVRREEEPYVGYSTSLLLGVALLAVALWCGARLPLPGRATPSFGVAVALSTLLTGLLLLVARRSALHQVIGYLVFENGIFGFGVPLVRDNPLLVEMGVLLDVFVGVFVMGITLFHLQRDLRHLSADRLSALRDSDLKDSEP
jgi:hydrogenase-4 component E